MNSLRKADRPPFQVKWGQESAITIKLSAAEEASLRAQALRERRYPETIIHALVRAGLEPTPAQVLLNTPVSEEAHARVVSDAGPRPAR